MKKRSITQRGRRSETNAFRFAMMQLRAEMEWSQATLAVKLGVSKRTVSHWENGYWLPPFKQRLHLVLAVREAPPEHVLAIADGLGVSVDPAVAPLLQPFRDALSEEDESEPVRIAAAPAPAPVAVVAPARPAPPPELVRVGSAPELLRATVDAIVRDAADAMNVPANDLRAAIGRVLATCDELGATMPGAREAVAVRARAKRGTASDA